MALIDWYHRLPYGARCLAASLKGRQLARGRYDAATPRRVMEALRRETLSPEAWRGWQQEALASLLHRAVTQVPYYRDHWQQSQGVGQAEDWRDLSRWPVLTKEALRRQPEAFLAEDVRPGELISEHTSGSSGQPLHLWRSLETNRAWYSLAEARLRTWHGADRTRPWALLGGQLVAAASQKKPPFWVWSGSQNQLYLSAYHLSPEAAPAYAEALRRYGVEHLLGYPSGLGALASMILEQGLKVPRQQVILTNAEPLSPWQRQQIQEAFQGPVRDTYGMAEMACAASECPEGRLHLWPEVGVLELLRDDSDEAVADGEPGRVVATGLLNGDMPLIRYEVGDRAIRARDPSCPCGRSLPILESVEGRQDDVLVTPSGRRIGRLDPVFKADFPLREAQIVQVAADLVLVKVVPAAGYGEHHGREILQRMKDRLGDEMRIEIEPVEALPRGPGGKVRGVVAAWRAE